MTTTAGAWFRAGRARLIPGGADARAASRSAILTSDLVFAMGALKMGVAMTPRQLIEGRAIMARTPPRTCVLARAPALSGVAVCSLHATPTQGVAIGLASIVGPVYIAECAPNSMRAMMVVMYAIEIGVGTVRRRRSCDSLGCISRAP